MTFDKQKRKRRKIYYNDVFIKHNRLLIDEDLSIPEGKYYTPICILTSDLVLRENIPDLQTGLIKLFKRQHSHRFFCAYNSIDEILENIENMDDTLMSWYESIEVGRFDFEIDNSLNEAISYFDVEIKNINSSYLSLEFHLYLADSFIKMQTKLINNNYVDDKGYIKSEFMRNSKTSGGKRTYTVRHYSNAHLKSDLISENITILKWRFYDKMQKYFPTLLHQKNSVPPSINIYKTNISYKESTAHNFWSSVGISSYQGQFIDESRKLFFKTNYSGRYEYNHRTDLVYIVNEATMKREIMYYSKDFQIINEFAENLSINVFKFALLDALNDLIAKECVIYKSKLNKVKLEKNRLSKLLKLRYEYEKDIDFYRRYVSDNIWKKAEREITNVFEGKHLKHSYDYRILTESPIVSKDKILEQIGVLCAEFDDKTLILQHLAAYKNESKSRRINFIMLLLSIATVTFIVFPDLCKNVAHSLLNVWSFIRNIFYNVNLTSAFLSRF